MRIAFLAIFGLAWAQIQIEASDLPSPRSSYLVGQSRPRPGGPDFAATGAGYTWDFSQLVADTLFTVEWKSPLQVPQYSLSCGNASQQALFLKVADSFPSQGGISIRDIYAFLRKSSSQMSITGLGATINGAPITQCYQDPDELYMLPMTYGRTDSTTFWLRLNFNPPFGGSATLAQRGYRLHNVDGYGTITTPYGTFPCLRLRRYVYQRDTVYFNGFPVQRTDTSYIELEWLGRGQDIPLLRVQGQQVGSSFVPAVIQFKDTVRSSSLLSAEGPLQISPNPAREVLYLSKPGGRYEIYTLVGQRVAEGEVPADRQIRLPADLPEGVYFLRLRREGSESWHRFVRMTR